VNLSCSVLQWSVTKVSANLFQVVMFTLTKSWPESCKEKCKFMFNNDVLSDVKFLNMAMATVATAREARW